MSYTNSPLFGREAVLKQIEFQFNNLQPQIARDIGEITKSTPAGSDVQLASFITYRLFTADREALSEDYLQKFDLTLPALMKTAAFQALIRTAEEKDWKAYLEYYINFTSRDHTRYVRLLLDGMDT